MSEEDVTLAGKIGGDGAIPNQPHGEAAQDIAVRSPEGGFVTDVEGLNADGEKEGCPVFDVSPEEFFDNMKLDRRRLRFKSGSTAQKYHSSTRYNRPFYIRNKADGYLRKIGTK